MSDAIETIEYKDHIIKIYTDDEPINPREDDDCAPDTMVCFHSRYNLGDDEKKHGYHKNSFNSWDELKAQIIEDHDPVAILPLRLYDHSGISISTSSEYPFNCQWDSMMVGFIFMSKKEALKNWSAKRVTKNLKAKAEKYLQANVKYYDDYLTGNAYGFVIEDKEGEEIDSCWGFIGDIKYAIEEAKNNVPEKAVA